MTFLAYVLVSYVPILTARTSNCICFVLSVHENHKNQRKTRLHLRFGFIATGSFIATTSASTFFMDLECVSYSYCWSPYDSVTLFLQANNVRPVY